MRALSLASLLALVGMLSACGGGGGSGSNGSDLPSSALLSSDGLIAYVKELISSQTNETSDPIRLGDVTLPVSDTTEPVAVH